MAIDREKTRLGILEPDKVGEIVEQCPLIALAARHFFTGFGVGRAEIDLVGQRIVEHFKFQRTDQAMFGEQADQSIAAVNHGQMPKIAFEHQFGGIADRRVDLHAGDRPGHYLAERCTAFRTEEEANHIALGDDADGGFVRDDHDAALPHLRHCSERTVERRIRGQARKVMLHECVDSVELAKKLQPEAAVKVGFSDHAQGLALPVGDHQMPDAAHCRAPVSLTKIHLFADRVHRAAHQ